MGDPDAALAAASHTIKAGRCESFSGFSHFLPLIQDSLLDVRWHLCQSYIYMKAFFLLCTPTFEYGLPLCCSHLSQFFLCLTWCCLCQAANAMVVRCRYYCPSQSHFYLETQNAVAQPEEDGCVRVWSSTQSMDAVQSAVARVLALPAHRVNVGEVLPLLGPFCACPDLLAFKLVERTTDCDSSGSTGKKRLRPPFPVLCISKREWLCPQWCGASAERTVASARAPCPSQPRLLWRHV